MIRASLFTALCALHCLAPATAQTPAPFAGKTVTLIVGLEAGGGYDSYARLLARHMGKHLAGATFVVQNMPGAGSLTAANHVFNNAPRDGTVMATIQSGVAFEPLYGNAAARFRPTEFSWIGSINAEVSTCQVWRTSPVQTFDDAFTKEMAVGGPGTGADSNLFPQVLNGILGTKFRLVGGYPGVAPILLAIERGELDGICGVYWSSILSLRPQWFRDGSMKPLIQLAIDKHPRHLDVPLATERAKTPGDRLAMELIFGSMKFARPFMAPPGVAPERVAALREAFDATMKDPEFLAEADKLGLEVGPLTGREIGDLLTKLYAAPPEVVQRARVGRN